MKPRTGYLKKKKLQKSEVKEGYNQPHRNTKGKSLV